MSLRNPPRVWRDSPPECSRKICLHASKPLPSSDPQSWLRRSYKSVSTWSKIKPSSAVATSQALTLSMYAFSKLACNIGFVWASIWAMTLLYFGVDRFAKWSNILLRHNLKFTTFPSKLKSWWFGRWHTRKFEWHMTFLICCCTSPWPVL